jgi:hypothetical protein
MTTAPEDRIRELIATPATTARPTTPKSSVPKTPVNQNTTEPVDPIQAEIDRINAARKPGRAVLDDTQYPTKLILSSDGRRVQVYTAGPLAGKEKREDGTTGDFIVGTEIVETTGGGSGGGGGGGSGSGAGIGAGLPVAPVGLTANQLQRKSAYDILYSEFKNYGLESLVEDVKGLIMTATSDAELTIGLRNSENYKKRFAANIKRVANGFKAIDEATYLGLEDKYQQIAQNYGLPSKYYSRGQLGVQQYFEDAIAKNIDPITFEERIVQGQKVLNANREVLDAAKKFYPDLNDSDFLDYVLNPENALSDIKRKVSAAEIGGAQMAAGLQATRMGAEDLIKAGVTGQQYQSRASAIAEGALRGGQLASIYEQDPYTQQSAEQVALNIPGSAEALKQTKKLTGLEKATFGGKSGLTGGALARDRAGAI